MSRPSHASFGRLLVITEIAAVGSCLLLALLCMAAPSPSIMHTGLLRAGKSWERIDLPFTAPSSGGAFTVDAVVLLLPWQKTTLTLRADDCLDALWVNAVLVETIAYPLCYPDIHTVRLGDHLVWGRNLIRAEVRDFGGDAAWHMLFDERVTRGRRAVSILVALATLGYCWFRLRR